MNPTLLILPGLYNSGAGHWQTLWETHWPNARRVQQANWDRPHRPDWVAALDVAIAAAEGPVILVAHSLGCALTAWWAGEHQAAAHAHKVTAALLVAPPDIERADFPEFVTGFAPMPRAVLPFKTIVAASSNDPWCALPAARALAAAWGAQFHAIGPCGHINAESGLAAWPQGVQWIRELSDR